LAAVGVGRLRVLCLVLPLVATAGCTTAGSASRAQLADVAVPSYAPPSGAPNFCATLAGTTHLTGLPVVLGTLTTQPEDVGARLELTAAADELQQVLDQVSVQTGGGALFGSLKQLVAALREARDTPLTDQIRTQISTGLDDVGRRAQAACRFPS
jgi:hypothetical protein